MVCNKCGNSVLDEWEYCEYCGIRRNTATGIKKKRISRKTKLSKVLSICVICLIVAVFLLLCTVFLINERRDDFDFAYKPEAIKTFLNKVCRNIDCRSAKVVEVNGELYYGYSGAVEITTKDGEKSTVSMSFDTSKLESMRQRDDELVEYVRVGDVYISGEISEHDYECKKLFLIGLEKTLFGDSVVEKYLTEMEEMDEIANSMDEYESRQLAGYTIEEKFYVSIMLNRVYSEGWSLHYRVVRI